MMHDWNTGWTWWWMIPMMVFMAAVVVGIVWAIAHAAQPPSSANPGSPAPEQILANRLASGEIDADEYSARLDALHDASHR